jgi:hypothetical protein
VKKKPTPAQTPNKEQKSQALEDAVRRYKRDRQALANKLFRVYDLELVATIAAKISKDGMQPSAAANQALKLLDACEEAISARKEKFAVMINAEVPVYALKLSFSDGICAITNQKRLSRAEEYFRKFLVSELGSKAAADELKRLKRDGFTIVEERDYEGRYAKFRPPRKQKS